jgi:hypothetical protein
MGQLESLRGAKHCTACIYNNNKIKNKKKICHGCFI